MSDLSKIIELVFGAYTVNLAAEPVLSISSVCIHLEKSKSLVLGILVSHLCKSCSLTAQNTVARGVGPGHSHCAL